MSSLPPELVDSVDRLRVKLVKITDSEQSDMTNVVASASHTERVPEIQAVLARCRQRSAAAAAAAIDTFRDECSEIGAHATSLTEMAIVAAAAKSVSEFWMKWESSAAAFVAEAAALLPDYGPEKITQEVRNTCNNRASSINHYFEQLAT